MASSHSWVSVALEIIFYCQKSSQDPPASVTISCFNNASENPEWIAISIGVIILYYQDTIVNIVNIVKTVNNVNIANIVNIADIVLSWHNLGL